MLIKTPLFKFTFIVLFVSLFITSCNDNKKKTEKSINTSNKIVIKESFKKKVANKTSEEYMLFELSCLYCHKITKERSSESMIAPDMDEVVAIYKKKYPAKTDFVKAIIKYKKNPSEENSFMKDAIKKYGKMPANLVSDEDIEEIANFLYEVKF